MRYYERSPSDGNPLKNLGKSARPNFCIEVGIPSRVVFAMKTECSCIASCLAVVLSKRVEPIRCPKDIARLKALLQDDPRDYGLIVFGLNTAFRASELVIITIRQVVHLRAGDILSVKEPKTGKIRMVMLNASAVDAVRRCIAAHPNPHPDAPLFWSKTTKRALRPDSLYRIVKGRCAQAGIPGHFGSHTLRKTWGYQQRVQFKEPLSLLVRAFGHSRESQTLEYLCILPKEIENLYANEV